MRLSLDSHKLIYHLGPLLKWLKGERVFPLYCSISPTDICNYRCIFCVYDSLRRNGTYLDKAKTLSFIQELGENGLKGLFFSGEGEPLLHPHISEIISASRGFGIDCALNTNGYFLTEQMSEGILKNLTFIRISLNGCGPENYQAIHNAPHEAYERILRNLGFAAKIKRNEGLKTTIGVQCIILKENIEHITRLANDLKGIGIDYLAFKPFLPISSAQYRTDLNLSDSEIIGRLRECEKIGDEEFQIIIRWESLAKYAKRAYDKCLSLPFMIEIDSKGDVYPCGVLLGNKDYAYGNIYTHSYKGIINSKTYKSVTRKIYDELDVHNCMPNCRNDAVNRLLWSLKNPPEHINFI